MRVGEFPLGLQLAHHCRDHPSGESTGLVAELSRKEPPAECVGAACVAQHLWFLCPGQEAELPADTACTHLALVQKGLAWRGPEKLGRVVKLHTHRAEVGVHCLLCLSLP